jgi:uncharacterized protein (TIGR03067 family)
MKWTFTLAFLGVLILGTKLTFLPAAEQPNESSKALKALHGIWKLQGYEARGEKYPNDNSDQTLYVFVEDTMLVCTGAGVTRYKLKLDPTASPKCFDREMVLTSGIGSSFFKHHEGTVQEGIYDLKGDELRICFNIHAPGVKERPQKFSTRREGPEVFMYTLKREKPKSK